MKLMIVKIIIVLNVCFCIGLQSLELPVNVNFLATGGFGVASNHNDWLNPAVINDLNHSSIEFSSNNWIPEFDVKGSYMGYQNNKQKLYGYYWKIDDIPINDGPSDIDDGYINSKILFINYSQRFDVKENQFGLSFGYSYMNLLEKDDKGYKIDFGYKRRFSDKISVAFAVKNILSQFKDDYQLPKLIALGSSHTLSKVPLTFYLDIFHDEDKEFGIFQGFLFDIKSINLLGGYRYYDSTDELDYSFGLKMNYNNIEIGIATLLKEEDSLSPSTFYQISYHF